MLQNLRVQPQRSDAADPAWRWMSLSWLAVVIGSVYILSAKLSLSLLTPDAVAVFWPAAGVAAGALIAFGPGARWAVVAGTMAATIVANLLGDRNLLSSLVFAICNAGEALLTAWLIERFFGSPFSLDRLRHVLGLLGAAIVAAAVSSPRSWSRQPFSYPCCRPMPRPRTGSSFSPMLAQYCWPSACSSSASASSGVRHNEILRGASRVHLELIFARA
jgi:hypothetical protein